jgi:hypothetical protein
MHTLFYQAYISFWEKKCEEGREKMNTNSIITTSKNDFKGGSGYKVIEVNVAVSEAHLYAVCTPIKKQ